MSSITNDYIATLTTMVLIRSNCDNIPVNARNLLENVANINWTGEELSFSNDENGKYTITIPKQVKYTSPFCANMLLSLLLDNMGRSFKNANTKKRLEDVFAIHLLCPYPILCLIKHYELPDKFFPILFHFEEKSRQCILASAALAVGSIFRNLLI